MSKPEDIITTLPTDWVSLDSVIVEVMHKLGDEIAKRNLSRVARLAGIPVKQMPIVVPATGKRGPRQRTRLVMCIHRDDLESLVAEIEDRLKHNTTLFDAKQQKPDPTPEEIRERAAECRETWADYDWVNRGSGRVKAVETPQLHVEFKRGQVYNIG